MEADVKVFCPHCLNEFYLNEQPREEILNSSVSITRRKVERSSWQEIDELVSAGYGYQLFNIGDTVSFTMKNGTNFAMDVAAMNVGGESNVVLVAHDCLPDDHVMNERNVYGSAGGYSKCSMARYLDKDILSLFPDDFVAIIKPREITQCIDGTTYTSVHKLWLPSQTEMFAEYQCDIDVGDEHFPLFSDERSRVKMRIGGKDTIWYWLRTPHSGNGFSVRRVYTTGTLNYDYAYSSNGVAPACVIGNPIPNNRATTVAR